MVLAMVHGFLLALGLILPLGVQNVFVFNQGVRQSSWWRAFPVVMMASICDTLLISLAIFGVSVFVLEVAWFKWLLTIVGLFFLGYMGWVTWRSKPSNDTSSEASNLSFSKQIVFAASVSLLNPHAILDTIGVIGTSSLVYSGATKWAFAIACTAVSWMWFTGLMSLGRLTGRLDTTGRVRKRLNQVSALIMWGSAVFMAWSLLH